MMYEERGLSQGVMIAIVVVIVVATVVPVTIAVVLLSGPQDLGDFKVVYYSTTNPTYQGYAQAFQQSRMFEQIADGLNSALILPRDITVILAEGGTVNAWYDPSTSQIVMTYEIIAHFEQLFSGQGYSTEQLSQAVTYTTVFVFFHETGHALVDVYKLPITGKEEDAVDQLATLIFTEAGAEGVALTAAQWFYLAGQQTGTENLPFWDVHSLDMQRYYDILALVYGKDPQKYSYLVPNPLPESRAQTAQYYYQQILNSWTTLLSPYEKK